MLNQNVDNHWQSKFQGTAHEVEVKPNSRVSRLVESGSRINSIHRQSVKELAPSLVATARDPRDGTIEAYESNRNTNFGYSMASRIDFGKSQQSTFI